MRKGIVDRDVWDIVIWYNPNSKEYYYRLLSGTSDHSVGYKNSYDHEIIMIIKVYKDLIKPKGVPFFLKILKKLIRFLQDLDNKLTRKYTF